MKIARSDCPAEFFSRPQDFEGSLFVARITRWDQVTHALGKLDKFLGCSSDVSARTEGILLSNAIDFSDFSDDVLRCLPQGEGDGEGEASSFSSSYQIPEAELSRRRDLRRRCVFTIDPSTARDLVR